ncbi:MAG: FtsW/RodA/SpoVE family cell cycle protein [bacterium]|nr:FtsW/RodA/SpoVE family cell cycle protein [bacterium]
MIQSLRRLDWALILAVGLLAAASLLSLASVAPQLMPQQAAWFVAGFCIIIFGSRFEWVRLGKEPWFRAVFYWFSIALLAATYLQSGTIRGTKSWLIVGPLQFQPVELMKVALIIVYAGFFSRRHIEAWWGKNVVRSFLALLPPALLTVFHPDLGSALILAAIWASFLLMSGPHAKRLLAGLMILLVVAGTMWVAVLKPYQKDRVLGFVSADQDPLGINYNVVQSKVAIGSGGLFGKGFGGGTQAQLHFLPEAQSDFLFAAFVEEWGFVGASLLLLTFLYLLFRLSRAGVRARDNYSRFVVLGAGVFFLVHFFINVGSAVGLIPVAGITFPFFSYGGSNVLTGSILLSIIQSIHLESSS